MPKITPKTARTDASDGVGDACGAFSALLFSDSGGLTQFGAFVETLPPGSSSALKHWHAGEDEMVYVLSGAATVLEGDDVYPLGPGEAATFKAGVAAGHCVQNRSDAPLTYMVIGTRSAADVVTYPDHDRVLTFRRDPASGEVVERRYSTLDGTPADKP